MIEEYGEDEVQNRILGFKCSRNPDLEDFLYTKSISFEKRNLSRTYLAISDDDQIIGYFTLGIRCGLVSKNAKISESLYKKLNVDRDTNVAQMFLIAQLGRSDSSPRGLVRNLMDDALNILIETNRRVGCRVIRVDCKNDQSLINYYSNYGFTPVRLSEDNDLVMMVGVLQDWERRVKMTSWGMITEQDLFA